mmetsp:Transcript_30677/g.99788  ORF Transcript_30677/g.99788 Transcript_30677/m.99788 type:complete len:211 (+) Transcript_30677:35-667(+)
MKSIAAVFSIHLAGVGAVVVAAGAEGPQVVNLERFELARLEAEVLEAVGGGRDDVVALERREEVGGEHGEGDDGEGGARDEPVERLGGELAHRERERERARLLAEHRKDELHHLVPRHHLRARELEGGARRLLDERHLADGERHVVHVHGLELGLAAVEDGHERELFGPARKLRQEAVLRPRHRRGLHNRGAREGGLDRRLARRLGLQKL